MSSTDFTDGVTLTDDAWFDDVNTYVYGYLTSISGADTIAAAGPASMAAYSAGQRFRFIAAGTNTGAVTLNITPSGATALGAKAVTRDGTTALIAGDITSGMIVEVVYDGTRFQIARSSPAGFLGTANSWTKAQRGTPVALTSAAASIAVDLSLANNFTHTLTENTTLAAPSNAVAGQSGVLVLTQHASAPKTLAYNAFWKFPSGVVPVLTATNSAVDTFSYYVESATRATCNMLNDVK